jgi:hypothetical protein
MCKPKQKKAPPPAKAPMEAPEIEAPEDDKGLALKNKAKGINNLRIDLTGMGKGMSSANAGVGQ